MFQLYRDVVRYRVGFMDHWSKHSRSLCMDWKLEWRPERVTGKQKQ